MDKITVFLPGRESPKCADALEALGVRVSFTDRERCAGLLLPGGGDVHPRRYGQELRGAVEIDEERDAREWEAVDRFLALGRPILGICRGAQLLNVYFGGTLLQDIPGHSRVNGRDTLHRARTEDPVLRELYGETFTVNSSHHQAVDRPGRGLRATTWAEDGTVEAFRHDTLPVLGIQWHPERQREPIDGWSLLSRWLREL